MSDGVIPLGENDFLIVGDSAYTKDVLAKVPLVRVDEHILYKLPYTTETELVISLPKVSTETINSVVENFLVTRWGEDTVTFLPSEVVLKNQGLDDLDNAFIPSLFSALEVFDFDSFVWEKVNWSEVKNDFLRTVPDKSKHEMTQYFIARQSYGERTLSEVNPKGRDWMMFLACIVLRKNLGWRYEETAETLCVPKMHMRLNVMPSIIRRTLCTRPMRWPEIEGGEYRFTQIPKHLYQALSSKYHFLGPKHAQ